MGIPSLKAQPETASDCSGAVSSSGVGGRERPANPMKSLAFNKGSQVFWQISVLNTIFCANERMHRKSVIFARLLLLWEHHMKATFLGVLVLGTALVLSLIGIAPGSVRADEKPIKMEGEAIWPLKNGAKWVYSIQGSSNSIRPAIRTSICDEVEVNKVKYYRITNTHKYPEGKTYLNYIGARNNHALYSVEPDGIYQEGGDDDQGAQLWDNRICTVKFTDRKLQWDVEKIFFTKNGKRIEVSGARRLYKQGVEEITVMGKDVKAICVEDWTTHLKKPMVTKRYYVKGIGYVGEKSIDEDGKVWHEINLVSYSTDSALKVGEVIVSSEIIEREVPNSVESVEAVAGVVTEFKKSRTISREVSYSTKIGIGVESELKLSADLIRVKGELTTVVKGSVEKAIGEKLMDSETREQTVKIDGDKLPKAKILWIDVYRAGTVEVTTSEGKTHKIPFEFPIGTKLVIRKP